MKTSSHGSGALVFCPMAATIEQVLQALGQMTEILRLWRSTKRLKPNKLSMLLTRLKRLNQGIVAELVWTNGISVESRSSSLTTTGRTSASSLPRLLEQSIRK